MKALFLSTLFILSAGVAQSLDAATSSAAATRLSGDELVCNFICAHDDGEPIGIGDADIEVDCDQNNHPDAPPNTPTEACAFEAMQACADAIGADNYEEVQIQFLGCHRQPRGENLIDDFSPRNLR